MSILVVLVENDVAKGVKRSFFFFFFFFSSCWLVSTF